MAFCGNCGKELAAGAKFCFECGAPVGKVDETIRRTVFSGEIRKCPSCGEVLQSMTAICPACGHEISSAKLPSTLKNLIDEINECDKIIANTHKITKRSWKTWMKGIRVLWVILNIFTLCIPLVIYLSLPLFRPLLRSNATPELSSTEQRKVVLIENFTLPNDRESLLEALLFIKSKMAFISSGKTNEKNAFWLRLWNTKATQLHQKANILLSNDAIAEAAYSDIIASKKTVDKKIRIRAGIGLAIITIYAILVIVSCSLFKNITNLLPDNSGLMNLHIGEEFEWIETGLSTQIPAVEASKGKYITNSDTELNISVERLTYSQFEKYISDCKNAGYTVDASKDTDSYTAHNDKGYYLELQYYSRDKELDIELKAPLKWPAHDIANMIPKIANKSGKIATANDEELSIVLYGVTDSWLENYIAECKNVGYTIEISEYAAYNAEGYYLELLRYYGDYIIIELKTPLKWPAHDIASVIPEITGKSGRIETSTDEKIEIWIYGVTENEFVTYMAECENKGFTIDSEQKEKTFSSFNSTGHKLTITLEDTKQLSITIDAPMALTDITWPSSGPATLIPKPSFSEGRISSDYDWAFSVYLREMTIEEFNDYVDKCIDNGFEKGYRSEHYFSADKGEDISLRIEYLGNNTVVIRIDDLSKLGD